MQGSHRPRYLLPPIYEVLHSTTEISESGRARKGRAEEEKPGTESADTQPDDARDKKVLRPRALPPSL
jgi:hypothetical protein